jgi:hypothetical protein
MKNKTKKKKEEEDEEEEKKKQQQQQQRGLYKNERHLLWKMKART